MSRPGEVGQGDGARHGGRENENQVPPMLLAGTPQLHGFESEEEREHLG